MQTAAIQLERTFTADSFRGLFDSDQSREAMALACNIAAGLKTYAGNADARVVIDNAFFIEMKELGIPFGVIAAIQTWSRASDAARLTTSDKVH